MLGMLAFTTSGCALLSYSSAERPDVNRSPQPADFSKVTPVGASDELTVLSGDPAQLGDIEDRDRNPEKLATEHFSLGQAYSLEGNHDAAVEEFKHALIYDAESPIIHTRLASEYVHKGLMAFAMEECKNALKADPQYDDARLLLAGLYGAANLNAEALHEYDVLLKKMPLHAEATVFKGSLLLEGGKVDAAVALLENFVKQNSAANADSPKESIALAQFYLGRAYQQKGDMKRAIASLKIATELKVGFTQAVLTLGLLYEKDKKADAAIHLYDESFARSADPHLASRLAQLYLEKNDFKNALNYLKVLENIDEENLTVKMKLGLLYVELKEYQEALRVFEGILAKNSDAEKVRFYQGAIYEQLKQFDRAIEAYSKVSTSSASYGEALIHIGYLHRSKGDIKAALQYVDRAIEQNENFAPLYSLKATILEELERASDGVTFLEVARLKFPNDERILYSLGALLDKQGRPEEALKIMKELLAQNANNAYALNYVAYNLAMRGEDLKQAEKLIRRAMALQPGDPYIQDSFGLILMKRGKSREGLRELEKAYALKSSEPVIIEHLADAYLQNQLRLKAHQKYEEALQLVKDSDARAQLEQKIAQISGGGSEPIQRSIANEKK